jgi:DNA end-binding protein Ku
MGLRASWSGQLGLLGLISIPVKLFPGVQQSAGFKRLCPKCGSPVGNAYKCTSCSKEMSYGEWRLGYDPGDGQMIPLDPERVSAIKPVSSSEITVIGFMRVNDLDPLALSGNHYFVAVAEKKGKKAAIAGISMAHRGYVVFRDMLMKHQLVAIGRFVDREQEHYVCIRPYRYGLLLTKMHFSDYLRDPDELFGNNLQVAINQADIETMRGLVEQTEPVPPVLKDEFAARVLALVTRTKESGIMPHTQQNEVEGEPITVCESQPEAISIFTAVQPRKNPVEA